MLLKNKLKLANGKVERSRRTLRAARRELLGESREVLKEVERRFRKVNAVEVETDDAGDEGGGDETKRKDEKRTKEVEGLRSQIKELADRDNSRKTIKENQRVNKVKIAVYERDLRTAEEMDRHKDGRIASLLLELDEVKTEKKMQDEEVDELLKDLEYQANMKP